MSRNEAREGNDHGDALADRAPDEHGPSSDPVHEPERGQRREGVDRGEHTAEDEGESSLKPDGLLEEDGGEVDDATRREESAGAR